MRYLAWLNANPLAWPLVLLTVSVAGMALFVVLTSITI